MNLVGTWQETKDGMLIEVTEDNGDQVKGTQVLYENPIPVRYGEEVTVNREDLIDLEEEE